MFLQNAYYRSRTSPQSYTYILYDEPGEDTTRISMSRMRPLSDIDIEEYEEFRRNHDRFYLLAHTKHPVRLRLIEEGCKLELVHDGNEARLDLVIAPLAGSSRRSEVY